MKTFFSLTGKKIPLYPEEENESKSTSYKFKVVETPGGGEMKKNVFILKRSNRKC